MRPRRMAKTQYLTAPLKTDKMPPGVPYIISSEAAERFSYYGMNSILVPFMTHQLLSRAGVLDVMPEHEADGWYHLFVFVLYFLPLGGAFLADAVLGKYRTIFYISIVYCFGHLALAIDHTRLGLVIGLILIAIGAGGIKPCVSATVGDQFGATNQHLLTRVFTWFYFAINIGSAFSTLLIPWLLEPYSLSPEQAAKLPAWLASALQRCHGPEIAFGLPGVLMAIAAVTFWAGRKKFVHLPPLGVKRYVQEILEPENRAALGRLLILVPFAAMFWGLWQQNFSSWVVQAENLDRHLFGIEWLPAQIQTVNPIFILLMLPLFSYVVYPALQKVVRLTPLRKMGIGLFVTAAAFVIIALIQVRIDAGGRPSVLWQVLAFVVLTIAEVLVSVTHLEFAYTQAPKKMKSLVMCTYLGSISLGNAFTAGVNFAIRRSGQPDRLVGASYFVFFISVMLVAAFLFVFFARFYKGRTYIQDEAEAEPAPA
jgi:POT family proton-dependent oligopeptide transporter